MTIDVYMTIAIIDRDPGRAPTSRTHPHNPLRPG
jgi:hypothetical protein